MEIGLFSFGYGSEPAMQKRFIEVMNINCIDHCLLDPNKGDFWKLSSACDAIIMHFGQYRSQLELASTFLPLFEHEMGKKCFPNLKTSWHYDDKIKQYYLLSLAGFNFVKSEVFYDRSSAMEFASIAKYPMVFKLRGGAGSSNVRLIKHEGEARLYIDMMFTRGVQDSHISLGLIHDLASYGAYRYVRGLLGRTSRKVIQGYIDTEFWGIERDYILFQEFCPHNSFDTRVTVIGDRAFAFRRFNRKNDFRASGSGLIDWDRDAIDLECIEVAIKVSKHFGFQSMAYDFIYDSNGHASICEISYTYQDIAVHSCPGYWDERLNWVEGHLWPQWCILSDLLDDKSLKSIR